jgi:hypothetical protein
MRASSPIGRAALACLTAGALAAVGAAGAQAASVSLRCAGKGPRNADSAGTVLCAGTPSKGRTLAGVVKDDAGRPVAARLTVTFSRWDPAPGGGFYVRPRATKTITAKSDGTFTVKDNPATKESIRVDVVADDALGISGASAFADISRKLIVRIAKLGGGVVRFTVTGTRARPIKVWVTDSSGYQVSGIKPKKIDGKGQATFNLSKIPSVLRLTYFIDAGDSLNDLFWYQSRVPFKR